MIVLRVSAAASSVHPSYYSSIVPTVYRHVALQQTIPTWRRSDTRSDDVTDDAISLRLRTLRDQIRLSEVHSGTVRDELELFTRAIDDVTPFGGGHHSRPINDTLYGSGYELKDKLTQSRNDLDQLEKLVDRTFGDRAVTIPDKVTYLLNIIACHHLTMILVLLHLDVHTSNNN